MKDLREAGTIAVGGHFCTDQEPQFLGSVKPDPGNLMLVGKLKCSVGGAVANTGLALHQLGANVSLMGKIGNDEMGMIARRIIDEISPDLGSGIIVNPNSATSYSIVESPIGVDRSFLHFPGANDTFCASDINYSRLASTQFRLFHFGYPPLMASMFANGGYESKIMFSQIKDLGLTTSLDLVMVNADSEAGRADWRAYHKNVLPFIDIFCPSLEEVLIQLFPELYQSVLDARVLDQTFDDTWKYEILPDIAKALLELGPAIVCLKLGRRGIYLRTTSDIDRLRQTGRGFDHGVVDLNLYRWVDRELLGGIYITDIASTNGAGDAAIAGLLAGLISGEPPEIAVHSALATASFRVQYGSINGIPSWQGVRERIIGEYNQAGPFMLGLGPVGWSYSDRSRLWHGPHDSATQ